MSKDKHLTKDQELELGRIISVMKDSKELIAEGNVPESEMMIHLSNIREGEAAVAKLVTAYTGMVHSKAKSFKSKFPSALEYEDLVQEGMAGLMRGIYHYDYTRGNKVSTVVTHWIFQGMIRWTNKTGRLVNLPENRVYDYSKIDKKRQELSELGYSAKDADSVIMKELNMTPEILHSITNAAANHASLNKQVSSDDNAPRELIEVVGIEASESSEDVVMKEAVVSILDDCLASLSPMKADIVASTFMLDRHEAGSMKAKEVQKKWGITAAKYKVYLNEALNSIKEDLSFLGMTFEDFLSA